MTRQAESSKNDHMLGTYSVSRDNLYPGLHVETQDL